jgi:hypothetical protein
MSDNEEVGGRILRKRSSEPAPWAQKTERVSYLKYDELSLT